MNGWRRGAVAILFRGEEEGIPVPAHVKGGLAVAPYCSSWLGCVVRARRDLWTITHVGTGLRVLDVDGKLARALAVANSLLAQADWTPLVIGRAGPQHRAAEIVRNLMEAALI